MITSCAPRAGLYIREFGLLIQQLALPSSAATRSFGGKVREVTYSFEKPKNRGASSRRRHGVKSTQKNWEKKVIFEFLAPLCEVLYLADASMGLPLQFCGTSRNFFLLRRAPWRRAAGEKER